MRVIQARDAARRWVVEQASHIPGFCGAYTAGSSNWLCDDAELSKATDLDIMVVLADQNQHPRSRHKFIYRDTLLEVSYLGHDLLQTPDQVLSDYHLAPSFRTTNILMDPSGHLAALLAIVCREYAKRQWVRKRCMDARDKVLRYLSAIREQAPLHDQVIAWLFAAGITTHILLVAGLRNPTVRTRYVEMREMLAYYGHLEFHETLLELLGVAQMSLDRVAQHLTTLSKIFDRAKYVIKTPFSFATDIRENSRPVVIDGSSEMIARGYHREAMFWIAVTHSRCQKVILSDCPAEMMQTLRDSYSDLVNDLRVPSSTDVRWRCAEIEQILPRVGQLAETIIAANHEVESDMSSTGAKSRHVTSSGTLITHGRLQ
jgi:hypothetical protein